LSRKDFTLYLETPEGKRPIPVEDVESLYLFGELDLNTKLLNFLAQQKIPLHVFNYYGYYSGSYYPREYLNSGFLLVQQVAHYTELHRRLPLVRELVSGVAHNLVCTLRYYAHRRGKEEEETASDLPEAASDEELLAAREEAEEEEKAPESGMSSDILGVVAEIQKIARQVDMFWTVDEIRGVEGKIRERYFSAWPHLLREGVVFEKRVRRPPDNMVNALISFGNGLLYSACLSEIYRSQLTPTVSFLHEPGARRFSLALDLSELFKPILVDRTILKMINTLQVQEEDFDQELNSCYLKEPGRKRVVKAFEEKLQTTFYHRRLKRHVSYKHLIRLECYKLIRHITGAESYKAFRAWW